jgi:SAM-dependent methyltransferase
MTTQAIDSMRETWETSFEEQIARGAYNTAPVEALVRTVSYYLRDRYEGQDLSQLHFCEMGCGAGPNLIWLAEKGIRVSGVDIAPNALALARENFERRGLADKVEQFVEGTVSHVPELGDGSLDGILESCVYQHIAREERLAAFREVDRLIAPGGVFAGHMLDQGHTVFEKHSHEQLAEDPGTVVLSEGGSNVYLTNIGLSHFFSKDEVRGLFPGWSVVDPCLVQYEIPRAEAGKRGYADGYLQSMLVVYAVK